MQNISDGLDILIAVIAMVLIMTVCAWSIDCIKDSAEVPIDERTALHMEGSDPIVPPVPTAKDGLLALVVADPYTPAPTRLRFKQGSAIYTADFNDAFFKDQEVSINTAWTVYLKDRIDANITSTYIDYANNCWVIELEA